MDESAHFLECFSDFNFSGIFLQRYCNHPVTFYTLYIRTKTNDMKSTFTFFLALLAIAANAQIVPNGNFENWTTNTVPTLPVDWTTEISDAQMPVTQDLDAYEGDFAMKVTSQETGIGEYASARTTLDIEYIPASLDFYVKTEVAFGAVQVSITFYNQDIEVISFDWFTSENIEDWTPVSIEMDQIEPIITHVEIVVSAQVGDFAPGDAIISVDAMGFGTISGVSDIENRNIVIYPNPANDYIQFSTEDIKVQSISVMDITGRVVMQKSQFRNGQHIEVSALPEGIYILSANMVDGSMGAQKFLVSR